MEEFEGLLEDEVYYTNITAEITYIELNSEQMVPIPSVENGEETGTEQEIAAAKNDYLEDITLVDPKITVFNLVLMTTYMYDLPIITDNEVSNT